MLPSITPVRTNGCWGFELGLCSDCVACSISCKTNNNQHGTLNIHQQPLNTHYGVTRSIGATQVTETCYWFKPSILMNDTPPKSCLPHIHSSTATKVAKLNMCMSPMLHEGIRCQLLQAHCQSNCDNPVLQATTLSGGRADKHVQHCTVHSASFPAAVSAIALLVEQGPFIC